MPGGPPLPRLPAWTVRLPAWPVARLGVPGQDRRCRAQAAVRAPGPAQRPHGTGAPPAPVPASPVPPPAATRSNAPLGATASATARPAPPTTAVTPPATSGLVLGPPESGGRCADMQVTSFVVGASSVWERIEPQARNHT